MTGNVDSYGRWEGPVEIVYEDADYVLQHIEVVNMKNGNRHGVSKVTWSNGQVAHYCYQHGSRVDSNYCEKKSAAIGSEDNSAYGIFSYKVPWFAFKLDALGFNDSYVKAYIDTLETIPLHI